MPSNYPPIPSWNTAIYRPSDGDNLVAASVNPAIEALANRTQYLYERWPPPNSIVYFKNAVLSYPTVTSGLFPTYAAIAPTVTALGCRNGDHLVTRFHVPSLGLTGPAGHYFKLQADYGAGFVDVGVRHQINLTTATLTLPVDFEAGLELAGLPPGGADIPLRLVGASTAGGASTPSNTISNETKVIRP